MNVIKKLASDTAIYGIPSIVGKSINFLLIFFFVGYFSPEELAPQVLFYGYATFFFVMLTHGMETAFFNFSRKQYDFRDVFASGITSVAIAATVFVILMLVNKQTIAEFAGYPHHTEYVVWFTLVMAVDSLKAIPNSLLRYLNKAKKFAAVKSLGIVINVGLNIFYIKVYPEWSGNDPDIVNVFISNLIASGVELLLLSPEIIKYYGTPTQKLWKIMYQYAWPLAIMGLAGMVNETFDRISLTKLLPPDIAKHEIGVYGPFYKLSMLMTIFIQAFRYAAEPLFFSKSENENAKNMYVLIMNWFIYACGAIFLGTSLFRAEIAEFVIRNPEYLKHPDGLFIVPVLLLANLFLGIFFNLSIWYKLNNKTKLGALISIVGAVVTVVLLFAYVPIYGFKAAAVTTLIAYVVMCVLSYFMGQKYYPVKYDLLQDLGLLLLAIALFLWGNGIQATGSFSYIVNIGLLLVYIAVGYGIILTTRKT